VAVHRHTWVAALALITAGGFILRVVDLGRAGLGNLFYASAVRSMGQSLANAWFGAYDPAGTLITDKPPLALWLQVLSTKLFGFHGWAIILPVALAGTLAIPLLFGAARRGAGTAVALTAAAVLAVFPESVATARDSTMDAVLLAGVAGAAWLLIAGVEDERPGLLVVWAAVMGLIFNIKYFEGFVLLPAALLYLGVRWRRNLTGRWQVLTGMVLVGAIVSLAWVTAIELTPRSMRPLVMNDPSDSIYGLVLRYNGLERVLPGEVTIFSPIDAGMVSGQVNEALARSARQFGVGDAGPLRLIRDSNGPLVGVTVLLALIGVVLALWRERVWVGGPGLFWIAWFVTGVVLFSFSNRAAAHYFESFVPAMAVMAGFGMVHLWRLNRGAWSLLLPVTVVAIGVFAWWSVRGHPAIQEQTRTTTIAVAGVAVLAAALPILPHTRSTGPFLRAAAIAAVLGVPLATSLWIAFDAPRGGQVTVPNPLVYARAGATAPAARSVPAEELLQRVAGSTARYAFGIDGINNAGEAIAYTGASVLPIWNEYERRPLLPEDEFERMLAEGNVPTLLLSRLRIATGMLAEVMPAVRRQCTQERGTPLGAAWSVWHCGSGRATLVHR
jgi:4-amino-4-deoxy-L-arabinose transferase-like glycosyltransferase